jgi:hypothetical protein
MKYIKLVLDNLNIKPNSEIKGHVTVNYTGAYDGNVINTLIMDSNKLIVYKSYNDEKISDNVSRLFISRDVMPDNKAQFTAVIEFEPEQSHDVKFRASIIEQHKEVESDQLFAKFSAKNLACDTTTFPTIQGCGSQ